MSAAAGPRIWTLGHTNHDMRQLVDLIEAHGIRSVVDVRSKPGLKWIPRFNRENIEPAVARYSLQYTWWGDTLGGIPEGDRFYDDEGFTLYQPLSEEAWFVAAIDRLKSSAARAKTTLLCLEEPPEECHRHMLLARVLVQRGIDISHIRGDGSIESYNDVERRLDRGQESLFESQDVWRSPKPMRPE